MPITTSLLACALNSTPAIAIVGPGETFASVATAVTAMHAIDDPDGSVVLLMPGVHQLEPGTWIEANHLQGPLTLQPWDRFSEVSITAAQGHGCLETTNVDLRVNDITFRNGSASQGGALKVMGGSLDLNNVTITNCNASVSGGGVFVSGLEAAVIEDCLFEYCSAPRGGGIMARGCMPEINMCQFNQCGDEGCRGGGIFSSQGVTLADVQFNLCQGDRGGAIHAGTLVMAQQCSFTDCTAYRRGGAVSVEDLTAVGLVNCVFHQNSTSDGPQGDESLGGAVYGANGGTLFTMACEFTHNRSQSGGAIHMAASSLQLRNTSFRDNTSVQDGGAVLLGSPDSDNPAHAWIIECDFHQNHAGAESAGADSAFPGGAILLYAGPSSTSLDVTILDSTIADNTASGTAAGVYALADGGVMNVFIDSCQMSGNSTPNYGYEAIDCSLDTPVEITNSLVCDHRFGAETHWQIVDGGGNEFGNWCCPGDVNDDSNVDSGDLLALLAVWGTASAGNDREDADRDGAVIMLDLIDMFQNWGACG